MSKLNETTTPVENKPRLEEIAIKDLVQLEVNKKTKREFQRMLVKCLLMQYTWCKLIAKTRISKN